MNQREMKKFNPLFEIIKKEGMITKRELWKKSSIGWHDLCKSTPAFLEVFPAISFDNKKQIFIHENHISLLSKVQFK